MRELRFLFAGVLSILLMQSCIITNSRRFSMDECVIKLPNDSAGFDRYFNTDGYFVNNMGECLYHPVLVFDSDGTVAISTVLDYDEPVSRIYVEELGLAKVDNDTVTCQFYRYLDLKFRWELMTMKLKIINRDTLRVLTDYPIDWNCCSEKADSIFQFVPQKVSINYGLRKEDLMSRKWMWNNPDEWRHWKKYTR